MLGFGFFVTPKCQFVTTVFLCQKWGFINKIRLCPLPKKDLRSFLNKQKTTIFFFSSNTEMSIRQQILQVAGVSACISYKNYLNLPSMVGISKYNAFWHLKDKIWFKTNRWKNNFLSQTLIQGRKS